MNYLSEEDIIEFHSMLTPSALAALEEHEASKEHIYATVCRSVRLSGSLADEKSRQEFREVFIQSLIAKLNEESVE